LGLETEKWDSVHTKIIDADNLGTAAFVDTDTLAPVAEGVINGNAHAHHSGDGGTISHIDLGAKGTNTHAQLDSHLANVLNPHSTSAAQVGIVDSSTTAKGIIQTATLPEALAGTVTNKAITPAHLGTYYALKHM
jgi:hypothetical protein